MTSCSHFVFLLPSPFPSGLSPAAEQQGAGPDVDMRMRCYQATSEEETGKDGFVCPLVWFGWQCRGAGACAPLGAVAGRSAPSGEGQAGCISLCFPRGHAYVWTAHVGACAYACARQEIEKGLHIELSGGPPHAHGQWQDWSVSLDSKVVRRWKSQSTARTGLLPPMLWHPLQTLTCRRTKLLTLSAPYCFDHPFHPWLWDPGGVVSQGKSYWLLRSVFCCWSNAEQSEQPWVPGS